MNRENLKLKVGDWVEVRSKEEILRTLDKNAQLDGMPFMPEMFAFCGKRFQVYKSAHKTCDTVFPIRGRSVDRTVHLDTRCDGAAHGGCQAACLIFWKEAWLKSVNGPAANTTPSGQLPSENSHAMTSNSHCTESDVWARTRAIGENDEPTYSCQATQLPYATRNLDWWDIRQYVEDLRSGNIGVNRLVCGAIYFLFFFVSQAGIKLGRPMRWFYDHFHWLWRGYPFPRRHGTIPEGESTPSAKLDLQPGELVRIKPYPEILGTLNTRGCNRGLYFDAEEVPYCGKSYRVLSRVNRIIDEKTGKMIEMKTPSIILDGVICESRYSECRLFCPRGIYPLWREIWLERVKPESLPQTPRGSTHMRESELVSGR